MINNRSLMEGFTVKGDNDLTKRELEVLNELARSGKKQQGLADILGISETTVEKHVANIKRKLHASNITHAFYIALSEGQIKIQI